VAVSWIRSEGVVNGYGIWGDCSSHDSDVRVARFGSMMMRSVPRLSINLMKDGCDVNHYFSLSSHVGIEIILSRIAGLLTSTVSEMTVAMALYAEWLFFYRLFRVSYARQDTVKNRRCQIRRCTRSIQKLPSIR